MSLYISLNLLLTARPTFVSTIVDGSIQPMYKTKVFGFRRVEAAIISAVSSP